MRAGERTIADFTVLKPAEVCAELAAVGPDARATFGHLNALQFNWRAGDTSWSVAQCFEHLVKANQAMRLAMDRTLGGNSPRTLAQRLPVLPGMFGRMLVKSQSPGAARKFTAVPSARPSASALDLRILDAFIRHSEEMAARLQALDGRDLSREIMVSPFASFIAYSVLDGWRLIAAHNRRHFEQARRVVQSPGFPI